MIPNPLFSLLSPVTIFLLLNLFLSLTCSIGYIFVSASMWSRKLPFFTQSPFYINQTSATFIFLFSTADFIKIILIGNVQSVNDAAIFHACYVLNNITLFGYAGFALSGSMFVLEWWLKLKLESTSVITLIAIKVLTRQNFTWLISIELLAVIVSSIISPTFQGVTRIIYIFQLAVATFLTLFMSSNSFLCPINI